MDALWMQFAECTCPPGDTDLTSEYATIRERPGSFDLVMLEVGAFHLGPANALKAQALLQTTIAAA